MRRGLSFEVNHRCSLDLEEVSLNTEICHNTEFVSGLIITVLMFTLFVMSFAEFDNEICLVGFCTPFGLPCGYGNFGNLELHTT